METPAEIIGWLESPEGEEWSRYQNNDDMHTKLLMELKDDGDTRLMDPVHDPWLATQGDMHDEDRIILWDVYGSKPYEL